MEMIEIDSGTGLWTLKDWEDNHVLLTSVSSCTVTVGKVVLRLYLRPYEYSLTSNNALYTNEWYSLWLEVLSVHEEPVYLKISTTVDARTSDDKQQQHTESQLVIQRSPGKGREKRLVLQEFILMKAWRTDPNSPGCHKVLLENVDLKYKFSAEEMIIQIKATTLRPHEVQLR